MPSTPTLIAAAILLGHSIASAKAQDATVIGNGTVLPGTGPGSRTDGVTGGRLMQAGSAEAAAKRQGLKPTVFLSSRMIGVTVRNQAGDSVGKIEDLLFGDGGALKAVVLNVSGPLGIGSKSIAVEPSALVLRPGGDRFSAVLNMSSDTLTAAQPFDAAKALAAQ